MKKRLTILGVIAGMVAAVSLGMGGMGPVSIVQAATIEVSQPTQLTVNNYYERGQSIVYDGTDYWLFYGRSATVTGSYDTGNPDINDYQVHYKKAGSIPDLAAATATLLSGAHNSFGYLGETGAAYFDGAVWAFATIVGTSAELFGWWTNDGGANWNEVGPIITGLSDGQAHHDEIVYNGELWVVEGSGDFTTKHSSEPKNDSSWSTPLVVDTSVSVTGGLAHFFVDGGGLYLAAYSNTKNYIYRYNAPGPSWVKIDEVSPPERYDPTLFKVNDTYVFAQAPWVSDGTPGGRQYIIAWSESNLDSAFFDGAPTSITAGQYGANSWVDMWPIGFTDAGGTSYLFYTSERNPNDPSSEIDGNIWYLEVDWDINNDHYTYIQNAIDQASAGDIIEVAEGTYNESVTIDKDDLNMFGGASFRPAITGGLKFDTDLTGLWFEGFHVTGNAVAVEDSIVRMYGAITNLTIDNCVFDGEDVSGRLGFSGGQLEGNVTITNSEFKRILGWALFESNSGSGGDGSAMGMVTFAWNYIHDSNGSVVFRGLSTDRTNIVNVHDNTWNNIGGNAGETGQHWAALEVNRTVELNVSNNIVNDVAIGQWGEGQAFQFWDIDYFEVSGNTITNNAQGIFIYGDLGGGLGGPFQMPLGFISGNCIIGNDQYGLSAEPTIGGPLDAEDNWWGAPTGPSGDGAGKGDAVFGDVDFDPWLKSLADTCKGFVTGGGSVDSPAGADADNPTAAGPATFSFVSKYVKGQSGPNGNLMFRFTAGDLNFESTSMEWLVVTGEPRAKFAGEGTINGVGCYKFMVDAYDGSFDSSVDAFGIRITPCSSSSSDRYFLSPTPLTSGSIVVHKK